MDAGRKGRRRARRRIGMSYVTTKYLDADGDGHDEAVVILKSKPAATLFRSSFIVYKWKDGKPELIWNFRTGDRRRRRAQGHSDRERG